MIKFKLVNGGKLPEIKTEGAACFDAYANNETPIFIEPNSRRLVPLGFCVELPAHTEMQVRPRSGLSKKGIDNAFGTVDEDYRGEVSACVINNSKEVFKIEKGDRICQLAIRQMPYYEVCVVDELSVTERGTSGFGSTGV